VCRRALAASFLTGMASRYGDPLSSVFSAETYSLGNIDPTAFICNRAGLLLGAALSCNPTSRGVGLAKTAGNLAISEVSGAIALQAEKVVARQVVKSGSSAMAQKTALTAEKYMVKGATPSLDALSKAGQVMDRKGITRAGRALDKHGGRAGSFFPKATGNEVSKNLQGQFHLDDILTHQKSKIFRGTRNQLEIYAPDGRGAFFSKDGFFRGFINKE